MAGQEGDRVERDTMGEVRVPAGARWGAQTQRAVDNFPISGRPIDAELVAALGAVKAAAAEANGRLRVLPADVAEAIATAGRAVAGGAWNDQFPVDVFQTGSGTSSNMNANEVIASLAAEELGRPVHPNDDVNASQSSNDVFPTAVHMAAARLLVRELLPALDAMTKVLRSRGRAWKTVVKAGRTHLMDATPVTLGQEFGGYAAQVQAARRRLEAALPAVAELPLGGSAVGTGINVPRGFAKRAVAALAAADGIAYTEPVDRFAAQASQDALVGLSGDVRTAAVALAKIADDIRWMGSGPRTGLGELRLPDLQPGSSIMPGKVNPVLCEAVLQVVAQVVGNDAAVAWAGARGNFELNVHLPVMARNLLESQRLLANVSRVFAARCVAGIEPQVERMQGYAESSPAVATSLNPLLGYEVVAGVVKEATASNRSIREVVLERGLLSPEQLDQALDVLALTRGSR